jgi:hypothetical protein
MAVLIVLFAIGGLVSSKKTKTNVNAGTRAVIVPTADAARTVLVPPCGTGTNVTSSNAEAVINTTGTIAIALPQGLGTRIVLVPVCSSATTNLPSAAFVPKPGTPVPPATTGSITSTAVADTRSIQAQLILPDGSAVRTVVVPPCNSHSPTPAQRILSASGSSTTAIAPAC